MLEITLHTTGFNEMNLDKSKEKIIEKKKQLKKQEQNLKEKIKKKSELKSKVIGKLAFQTGIIDLEPEVLLGAFLDIAEKASSKEAINYWCKKAEIFSKNNDNLDRSPLSISFQFPPSIELKNHLKETGFKWNKFRGEYYGYGNKEKIEASLKEQGLAFKLEVVK